MEAIKCVLVGDDDVGKTSLLSRYAYGSFDTSYFENDGVISMRVDGEKFSLKYWEEAARPTEHDRLRPFSYHETDVFLICFSVTCPTSFENVCLRWHPEVIHNCPEVPIILVGTKFDLREDVEILKYLKQKSLMPITYQQGVNLAEEIKAVKYLECSALTGEGLKNVFDEACRAVPPNKLKKKKPSVFEEPCRAVMPLSAKPKKNCVLM